MVQRGCTSCTISYVCASCLHHCGDRTCNQSGLQGSHIRHPTLCPILLVWVAVVLVFTVLPWCVVAGSSGPPAPHHLAKPCCLQPRAKPIPHHHHHLLLLFYLPACCQPQRVCQYLASPDSGDAEEGCECSSATDVAWQAFARARSGAGTPCCAVPTHYCHQACLHTLGLLAYIRAICTCWGCLCTVGLLEVTGTVCTVWVIQRNTNAVSG